MAMNDYYKILGVSENATPEEMKKQFRKLAKEYHPDRHQGDPAKEAKFKEIAEAYDTLSDPKKRQEYDMMRRYGAHTGAGNFGGGQGFPGGMGGGNFQGGFTFDFEDFLNRGSQRGSGIDDILNEIFGAGMSGRGFGQRPNPFGRATQKPTKGQDIVARLAISFTEAANGTTRRIELTNGIKLNAKIPAGIADGGKIRLRGQGNPSHNGGPAGDLIITVTVMPDRDFERKGNDIYSSTTISFKDAILGTKIDVRTLSKTVTLSVPAGTQPGTKLRLKEMGLDVGGKTGDHYVTINVTIPKSLTDEQREALERF